MLNVHETMIHSKTSPVQNHIKQFSTMDNWSHCIVFDKAQDMSGDSGLLMEMVHDRCSTLLTEFGTALTTSLPILFQYCYKYCYSDSRNLSAVMKAGCLAL
jgi:hypothetical protein